MLSICVSPQERSFIMSAKNMMKSKLAALAAAAAASILLVAADKLL